MISGRVCEDLLNELQVSSDGNVQRVLPSFSQLDVCVRYVDISPTIVNSFSERGRLSS